MQILSRVTAQVLRIAATPNNGTVEITAHSFDNYTHTKVKQPSPWQPQFSDQFLLLVEMLENNDDLNGIAEVFPMSPI